MQQSASRLQNNYRNAISEYDVHFQGYQSPLDKISVFQKQKQTNPQSKKNLNPNDLFNNMALSMDSRHRSVERLDVNDEIASDAEDYS